MAGAGYKLFNTGDVLTAAQVNTYLMEQTVMVFANAAARTTALSGVVSEGMISYLKDTNAVEVYDGSNWVSSDDPNAIQNTIVDAKGDLIAASAADTPARLAVGNNGETLVADSSTSTGLRWTPALASKNYVINGAMDWWQRGTSGFSAGGNYCADRWMCGLNSGTMAVSRSTDVPTSPYFNYSLSMVGTTAQNAQIFTRIESIEASQLAGQTVTLTVWAKSTAGTTKISLATIYPSATDSWGGSNTTDVLADLSGTSPSGSWTKYTATFTVNALATRGYQIIIYRNGTETSTTLITGIKLELGSVSTPFTRAGGTLAGELAAAMRYYFRFNADADQLLINSGFANSTTSASGRIQFPVPMRIIPTSLDSANLKFGNYAGSGYAMTSVGFNQTSNIGAQVYGTVSGVTAGHAGAVLGNTNGAYVGFSAEL